MHLPKKIAELCSRAVEQPVYHLLSFANAFACVLLLMTPVLFVLTPGEASFVRLLDLISLAYICAEIIIQLFSRERRRYRRSYRLAVDIVVVAPLFAAIIMNLLDRGALVSHEMAASWEFYPGVLLLRGTRGLRLVQSGQRLLARRRMGLHGERSMSTIKIRLFTSVSSILFLIVLVCGFGLAQLVHTATEAQRAGRLNQIKQQAQSFGALQSLLLFPEQVIAVKVYEDGERKTIYSERFSEAHVEESLVYGRDYEQIDELNPGESILIYYRDLLRRQQLSELAILAVGIFVTVALLLSLDHYINQFVLNPVERAARVHELRLAGEEIEYSDVPQEPYTEVIRLINMGDHLYQRMRAPARKLLEGTKPGPGSTAE